MENKKEPRICNRQRQLHVRGSLAFLALRTYTKNSVHRFGFYKEQRRWAINRNVAQTHNASCIS